MYPFIQWHITLIFVYWNYHCSQCIMIQSANVLFGRFHLHSQRMLVHSSFYFVNTCVFVWLQCQCNTGLREWVETFSLFHVFRERLLPFNVIVEMIGFKCTIWLFSVISVSYSLAIITTPLSPLLLSFELLECYFNIHFTFV